MLARANASESHEKQREFFGLTGLRLLNLIDDVKRIIAATPSADGKNMKPNSANIAAYLKEHVEWASARRVPSPETVNQLLGISGMLKKSPLAKQVFQMAEAQFGRDCFFEQYSKVLLISQRSPSVPDFEYVICGVFAQMVRRGEAGPFSKTEVGAKAGPLQTWLFLRKLNKHLVAQYPSSSTNPEQEKLMQKALSILDSPLEWLRNFPPKDDANQTWAGGLPPLLAAVLEFSKLAMSGAFNQILKGMLASPGPTGLTPATFLESDAMKPEKAKLDELLKKQNGVVEEIAAPSTAANQRATAGDDLEKGDSKSQLEKDASERAAEQISRSVVFLVPQPASTAATWSIVYPKLVWGIGAIFFCVLLVHFGPRLRPSSPT